MAVASIARAATVVDRLEPRGAVTIEPVGVPADLLHSVGESCRARPRPARRLVPSLPILSGVNALAEGTRTRPKLGRMAASTTP